MNVIIINGVRERRRRGGGEGRKKKKKKAQLDFWLHQSIQ
jgi:hypothetical protein